MKKILLFSLILCIILPNFAKSATWLSGRILLQVEDKGQAWYVSPSDQKRYSLGRPNDALALMRQLGIGISNENLAKIPVGFSANNNLDSDADGLDDNLEIALDTDKDKKDTDADGYDDKIELASGYNPLGQEKLAIDKKFTQNHAGKIFLQVEKNGEAWYLEPMTQKRYFLGRPGDAFQIMRTFGLGITNTDLESIPADQSPIVVIPPITPPPPDDPIIIPTENTISLAAAAIRAASASSAKSYFTPNLQKSIEYSVEHMAKENLLILANILSGSTLESSTATQKIYTNEVYFQGEKHTVRFQVEKQADGQWLMTNL